MTKKNALQLFAGSAFALTGVAVAQDADLDRAYAAALSADAQARTSEVLGSRDSAGFTIAAEGDNVLNIGALMQFRYTANFRDDDATTVGNDNEFTHGFHWARARIDFTGSVLTRDLTFRVSGDFGETNSGGDNDFTLTHAFAQYALSDSLEGGYIRFGSQKLPIFAEELVEGEYQLAADRSATNEFFSQQYSEAIMFGYDSEGWRGMFAVSDGINSQGTSFNSAPEADVALTARFDVKFSGDWVQFNDFTSFRNSEDAFRIGAAIHWQTFGDTNPSSAFANGSPLLAGVNDGDLLLYTVDATYESNGWALYAAFLGSYVDGDLAAGGDAEFDDFGVVVQGSYFFTSQIEGFVRYDGIYADEDRFATGDDNFNFLTFGANYYIVEGSHNAKATLDLVWSLDETAGIAGTFNNGNNTGLLGQDEDNEFAIRAQVQLLF